MIFPSKVEANLGNAIIGIETSMQNYLIATQATALHALDRRGAVSRLILINHSKNAAFRVSC